jgi:hypothetical protein
MHFWHSIPIQSWLFAPTKFSEFARNTKHLQVWYWLPYFDVSADSFAIFLDLILNALHADVFLRDNQQMIIDRLHETLIETNSAPFRQSLKLISALILTFPDFAAAYLSSDKNLIKIKTLIVSNYKNISMEAFSHFQTLCSF